MRIQTTRIYTEVENARNEGYQIVSAQGSSRSSKTYNIVIWLIVFLLRNPGMRLSIVRETLTVIKGSVFIDFKEILLRMDIFDDKALNKTEMIYRFPNGSWVEFFGTDNEQKLRGRKRDILYLNEANEVSFIKYQQLAMRTTTFTVLDYNPSFSEDHWLNDINKDPKTRHFITTYKDNPFLEQRIIDEIESLKQKNFSLWQIYGLGLQAVIEGLIFDEVHEIDQIPEHIRKRGIGVDFGYTNDPTAIVEVAVDGNDMYIDEKCYRTQMLTSDIIQVLKEESKGLKVISESADPRLVQEIYRAGINVHAVKKYSGSVQAGINKMLEYRIFLTKRSVNAKKEFKNYTYQQDKEGKWLNEPIDAYNHIIDAVRYYVMEEILGGRPKPIDFERLARAAY